MSVLRCKRLHWSNFAAQQHPMKSKTLGLVLVGFFILLSAVFFVYYYSEYKDRPKTLATLGNPGHHVQPFAFTNQDGKMVTEKDVAGKIYVVEYFFTTCKGICPKMNESMSTVYQAFKGNDRVKILSHTVDPETDTVEQLKRYSLKFDADPNQWIFLTGDKKKLYDQARYSYLINAVDTLNPVSIEEDFVHDQHFALVDGGGRLRGLGWYDGLNKGEVNQLIGDIKLLLDEEESEKK